MIMAKISKTRTALVLLSGENARLRAQVARLKRDLAEAKRNTDDK
jgi:hypothetical protein